MASRTEPNDHHQAHHPSLISGTLIETDALGKQLRFISAMMYNPDSVTP
jgi:hypothetical protein